MPIFQIVAHSNNQEKRNIMPIHLSSLKDEEEKEIDRTL